ncbi:MAG: hypothetical protein DMG21_10700 [Acidobacteria bacterium]|nr:MAG: hypothetical protein DMG21_10700 [Acidobacteriota bacterium]
MMLQTVEERPATPSVTSVERILAIMELLSQAKTGLTLPEISRRLSLPKSSTHCLLLTLERHGYLMHDPSTRRYLFDLKLYSLANSALNGINLRVQACPCLWTLSQRSHTTVHMAVLDHYEALIVEKVEPPGVRRQASWVGKRLELHCSAVGKALLAYLPEEDLMQTLANCRMPRHNDNTITSIRRLQAEIAETRCRGYSIEEEEDVIGTRCVGVPVLTSPAEAIAALSVAGTTDEIKTERIPQLIPMMKQTAAEIAEKVSPSGHTSRTPVQCRVT